MIPPKIQRLECASEIMRRPWDKTPSKINGESPRDIGLTYALGLRSF
nr:hypothetical protein [uncultured Porphyromonas sp.]